MADSDTTSAGGGGNPHGNPTSTGPEGHNNPADDAADPAPAPDNPVSADIPTEGEQGTVFLGGGVDL